MEENFRDSEHLAPNWGEIIRAYVELMDDVMPYLSAAAG